MYAKVVARIPEIDPDNPIQLKKLADHRRDFNEVRDKLAAHISEHEFLIGSEFHVEEGGGFEFDVDVVGRPLVVNQVERRWAVPADKKRKFVGEIAELL